MVYTSLLEVEKNKIKERLQAVGTTSTRPAITHFTEFDMKPGKQFIPPIYKSVAFNNLFLKVEKLTSTGISLRTQSYHLVLKAQGGMFEISLLSSVKAYGFITIKLSHIQYENVRRVLEAGGMKIVLNLEKKVETYVSVPLRTIYSFYEWSDIPTFLYIKTANKNTLQEALQIIQYTEEDTTPFSLEELYSYYGLPAQFLI